MYRAGSPELSHKGVFRRPFTSLNSFTRQQPKSLSGKVSLKGQPPDDLPCVTSGLVVIVNDLGIPQGAFNFLQAGISGVCKRVQFFGLSTSRPGDFAPTGLTLRQIRTHMRVLVANCECADFLEPALWAASLADHLAPAFTRTA